MSMLRAFIAIEIPNEIQQKIHQETANFRKGISSLVRWVPPQNMHLTLKFLGDVSPNSVEFLIQMLRNEAEHAHSFDMHLAGLGAFPNPSGRASFILVSRRRRRWMHLRAGSNPPPAGWGMKQRSVHSPRISPWAGSDRTPRPPSSSKSAARSKAHRLTYWALPE
jgi:hypothetical protein